MSDHNAAKFHQLVQDLYPQLLSYAIRRVSNPEDAADIVAETLTIVWSKIDDPVTDYKPWTFGIARNVVLRHHQGTARRQHIADGLRAQLTTQDAREPESDLALDVQAAMRNLADDDFELIALTAWDGLSTVEAAKVLEISAATARVRLFRARRKLKKLLNSDLDSDFSTAKAMV